MLWFCVRRQAHNRFKSWILPTGAYTTLISPLLVVPGARGPANQMGVATYQQGRPKATTTSASERRSVRLQGY